MVRLMPWARTDDRANGDAKLLALSDGAFRLWMGGKVYCAANLTDGMIHDYVVPTLPVRAKNRQALIKELTSVLVAGKKPLWHVVPGGYLMNDYLDWNDSREKILKEREATKRRVRAWRESQEAHNTVRSDRRNATRNGVTNAVRSAPTSTTSTTTTKTDTPSGSQSDQSQIHRRAARVGLLDDRDREIRQLTALCHADLIRPYLLRTNKLPNPDGLVAALRQQAESREMAVSEATARAAVERAMKRWKRSA